MTEKSYLNVWAKCLMTLILKKEKTALKRALAGNGTVLKVLLHIKTHYPKSHKMAQNNEEITSVEWVRCAVPRTVELSQGVLRKSAEKPSPSPDSYR